MQQTAEVIDIQPTGGMVIEYNITDAAIEKLSKQFSPLEITDTKSYKAVQIAIGEVRGYRISVERTRKELKKDALAYGRKVDTEAKRITALLLSIEEGLKAKKQVVDDQKAAEKAEKARIEAERVEGIRNKIADIQRLTVGLNGLDADQLRSLSEQNNSIEITADEYAEFALEAKQAKAEVGNTIAQALAARIKFDEEEAERKAEAERLEKIRVEQEAERKRLEEEQARIDAARKAEEERLAAEQAKIDAANRKIEKERERLEAEKQAEIDRKEREALKKRLAEEAKVKAEKDAKEKAEREEAERVAREKAEAEEAARQEALKPDKEKLISFANSLYEIEAPALTDKDLQTLASYAISKIKEIATLTISGVEAA